MEPSLPLVGGTKSSLHLVLCGLCSWDFCMMLTSMKNFKMSSKSMGERERRKSRSQRYSTMKPMVIQWWLAKHLGSHIHCVELWICEKYTILVYLKHMYPKPGSFNKFWMLYIHQVQSNSIKYYILKFTFVWMLLHN